METVNGLEIVESKAKVLIGYEGKVYIYYNDSSLLRATCGYAAIGCGEDFAKGSLFTTKSSGVDLSTKERIKLAILSANAFSVGVNDEITIIES